MKDWVEGLGLNCGLFSGLFRWGDGSVDPGCTLTLLAVVGNLDVDGFGVGGER